MSRKERNQQEAMAKKKVYAVRNGRQTGLFDTWEECRRMVAGYPNAVYKSFQTRQEAQLYINGEALEDETLLQNRSKNAGTAPTEADRADSGQLTVYVDGSFDPKIRRYSFGCILLTPEGKIVRESGRGSDKKSLALRNVAGEMAGAVFAVKWAQKNGYPAVDIRYDYAGIEQWATHGWQAKNELTKEYAAFMDNSRKQTVITFTKITAHTGNQYNEEADRLAKKALAAVDGVHEIRTLQEESAL